MSVKYAFIHSEESNYYVSSMCRWARVSRSGYHAWKTRPVSATVRRSAELAKLVHFLFDRSEETYGYRRVHADLRRWGYHVHRETVRALMRELDLVPCQPRPWRPVTTIVGDPTDVPDLVGRGFTADAPGCKLVGDITYIRRWEG